MVISGYPAPIFRYKVKPKTTLIVGPRSTMASEEFCIPDDDIFFTDTEFHTRAYSVYAAACKLGLLRDCSTLIVHVVGAAEREGVTLSQTVNLFGRLCDLLGKHSVVDVELVFVGPHVDPRLDAQSHRNAIQRNGTSMHVSYSTLVYHEYCTSETFVRPDFGICFNAGVWAYDEWIPTIVSVCSVVRCPLVLTAYNEHEAHDDEDALEDRITDEGLLGEGRKVHWLWTRCPNPCGSTLRRPSVSVEARVLSDNHTWQCISAEPSQVES